MLQQNRQVGENAAQRIVRLLAKFNAEMVEEGSGNRIDATFSGDGTGELVLKSPNMLGEEILYGFGSLEQLAKFLEARPLNRLVMAVERARRNGEVEA